MIDATRTLSPIAKRAMRARGRVGVVPAPASLPTRPSGDVPASPSAKGLPLGSRSRLGPRCRRTGRLLGRHLLAFAAGLLATATTFYFVNLLNFEQQGPKGKALSALTRFDVDKQPERKPKTRARLQKPKVVKRAPRSNDNRALIPNIASRIGSQGLNVDSDGEASPLLGAAMDSVLSGEGRARLHTSVFEASEVQKPARVVGRSAPAYPRDAIRAGITGYVRLKLLVDERGDIQRLLVDRAEPQGVFEAAAREAIMQWRFEPARNDGLSVTSWVFQTIRFELR